MAHHHPQSDSDAISRLQDRVEDLEKETKHLRHENERLRQTTKASVSRAEDLQIQLSEGSIQLSQLQGGTGQITDVEIRGELDSLANAIREWTTTVGRLLKKHNFQRVFDRNLAEDPKRMVDQILNFPSGLVTAGTKQWFEDWLLWLGGISTFPYIVLTRVIWSFLEDLFSARFPIGLPPEDRGLVTRLTPFIDPSHNNREGSSSLSRTWRATTLQAMTKTDEYKAQRKREVHRLWDGVVEDLQNWLPDSISRDDIAGSLDDFEDDIFGPAIALQQSLALSAYEYVVKPPEPMPPGKLPSDSELSSWSLVNAREWISEDVTQDVKGVVLILYPGVVRRRVEKSGKDVIMLKPTVVVFDDNTPDVPFRSDPFFDKSRLSKTPDMVDSDSPPSPTTPRGRSSPKKLKEGHSVRVSEDEHLDRGPEPASPAPSGSSTRAPSGSPGHHRRVRETRSSRPQETSSQGRSSSEKSSYDSKKKKAKEPSFTGGISSWAQGQFRRRLSHPASPAETSDQRRRGDVPGPGNPPRAATEGPRPTGSLNTPVFSNLARTAGMDPYDSRYTNSEDRRGH